MKNHHLLNFKRVKIPELTPGLCRPGSPSSSLPEEGLCQLETMHKQFLTNVSSHCHKAGLDLGTPEEFIVLVVVVIELDEQFLAVNNLGSKLATSTLRSFKKEVDIPQWGSQSACSRQG